MKSHKFHLLLGDLWKWSLLIGWDEWSHDFAVRFGQKENGMVVLLCIIISPHTNGIKTPPIDREDQELSKTFLRIDNRTIIKEVTGFQRLVSFWLQLATEVIQLNDVVSTCKPCGVHMETTWYPHGNHMLSTCKPCGIHLETMWSQYGNHAVSTWKQHGFYLVHGHHVVSVHTSGHNVVTTLTPHGFQVDTTWFPCGYHVVSMCTTCGVQVDNTWVQMWTLHDFHVKTTLFPCGHHIVSTWTPCGFYGHHMFPHTHHMVAMWILCGFHVHTM